MKVSKQGMEYLINSLFDIYNTPDKDDFSHEAILDFVMNEQDLIVLAPETDIDNLEYIVQEMLKRV